MQLKQIVLVSLLAVCSNSLLAQNKTAVKSAPVKPAATGNSLKNANDSLSYAIGVQLSEMYKNQWEPYFKQNDINNINNKMLVKALQDALVSKQPLIDANLCNVTIQQRLSEAMSKKVRPEIEKGEKFLAENKKRPGVLVTSSGLQYEVIKTGTGEKPVDGQNIKVIYNGTFIDGTRFDGSDKPVQFNINQLITGWTEALKMMTPGTKWKLYIPYQLAYGSQGRDGIPGGAALLFDLELVEIVK